MNVVHSLPSAGKPVRRGDTPRSLGMGRGDVIEVKRKEKLFTVLRNEEPHEVPAEDFQEPDSQNLQESQSLDQPPHPDVK